jgi:hypothetical protein
MNNHSIAMNEAKQFLLENPTENIAIAARFFKLKYTLAKFIAREARKVDAVNKKREGQNRVLNDQQKQTIQSFIRSLITHEILLTYDLVYDVIINMLRAYDCSLLFQKWFRK